MIKKILVTGGAGFIGSFIVDKLIENGNDVRILDNLEPQVHSSWGVPKYLNPNAEFICGDIRDASVVQKAIEDVEIIFNEAAMVGVGQSMYQIKRYVDVNTLGTANLLDILVNKEHDVKKLIVASSMSTYGEGSYLCENCGEVNAKLRPIEQMKNNDWEVYCPNCSKLLKLIPTKETKKQEINSIYALTKKDQEDMVINIGKVYGIPTVALRYFNVYGPRQSLSNPYTGVAAIFMSRIKNNNQPLVFEDGNQSRDFVFVTDIVEANILAMKSNAANYEVFNVGAGNQVTIKQIAEIIAKLHKKQILPKITAQFRDGDVRHCFSDITKIRSKLDYNPKVNFEEGMRLLSEWSANVKAIDKVEQATEELQEKGLLWKKE